MRTIKLYGGDLGSDTILVRADLCNAAKPVQVDYREGDGWVGTQYQTAVTRHRISGLVQVGKRLAAEAVGCDEDDFECSWKEID